MTHKLTPKQKLFYVEYQLDKNPVDAAIRAGYSPQNAPTQGPRLLALLQQRAETEEQNEQASPEQNSEPEIKPNPAERTTSDVLEDLRRLTNKAEDKGDLKTALSALVLEGKYLGIFNDKIDPRLKGDTVVVIRHQSTTLDGPLQSVVMESTNQVATLEVPTRALP